MTDDEIRRAPRLCFFAHYHPRAIVADYVLIYLRALADAGFTVVVLSTAALPEEEQAKLRAACALLIMRENVGLDFGGWMQAYARFDPIEAELLLLANDSVYGPLHDLTRFVDRLTAAPADFYGAVESHELGPHLQSWFLLLRPAAYRAPAFRRLMTTPIPPDLPKMDIIRRYEWGLTESLTGAGLRHHAAYSPAARGPIGRELPFNPTHLLWRSLVKHHGIPFLKVEVLRDNPTRLGGVPDWRKLVRRFAPHLVEPIAADVAMRGAAETWSLRERLDWSVDIERAVYWPELHHFMVRDAKPGGSLLRRLNHRAFGWAEWVGRRVRWRIKEARARG